MDFDITSLLLFINDILLITNEPPRINIAERFKSGIIDGIIENWKYYSFILFILIAIPIFKIFERKFDFLASLKHKEKEKQWKVEFEEKKRHKILKKIIKDTVPNWTLEILQSLDSKAFIKLVAEYFETKGFLIKYPTSIDKNTVDVFFLHQSENNRLFAIVRCRAIGGDLVSLKTVKSLYDLSRQYGLINLALVTTGDFEGDPSGLLKNKKGFNLIGAPQLISMLTALPLDEQTYLFANMMLNKN